MKYDIEKEPIGSGAFGTVRIARSKKSSSGKSVALKTITKSGLKDIKTFVNEVEIQAGLDHPNIAKLYETFEDRQQVYLVLEVCHGGEMFDKIIEQCYFREIEASFLMLQILRAVFYMHTQCIAHRDLKPENFLFTEKNVGIMQNTLKVIDFGIAKRFKKQQDGTTIPMSTKAGTAYYVAPEVINGRYTERCDVWSCGVILYILLSGMPPFEGDDDAQIIRNVKRGQIRFDFPEFNGVSKEAKDLILTLCTLNDSKRISAQEALNFHWVQQPSRVIKVDSKVAGNAFITRLRGFSNVNNFKKMALHLIAHRLDDQQIKRMKENFFKMDQNGDGLLTLQELKEGCSNCGIGEHEDIKQIFANLDTDGSGSISYTEFLASMLDTRSVITEETCWEAFQVFDKDNSGSISLDELQQMILEKHDDFRKVSNKTKTEIMQAFKEADRDGNGQVSFQEFVDMMNKPI